MLISVVALGSRGDVQPFVALGQGLAARGLAVRVACYEAYRGLVETAGLAWAPVPGDPQAILATEQGQAWMAADGPVTFIRRMVRLGETHMEPVVAAITAAVDGADAILYGPLGFPALHLGEAAGVPAALAQLQPMAPTGEFPSFTVPGGRSLGRLGNRLSHVLVQQLLWQLVRRQVDRWRQDRLGLPPLGWRGSWPQLHRGPDPILYAYSPSVLPRPADWPAHLHVTGFWFLDPAPGWEPSAELAAFLADGPPPVYVGFGSMVWADRDAAWRTVRAALRLAGVRAVVAGAPDVEAEGLHPVGDVPHAWLFPRMAAVVHHAGAGTTAAGLRAGVPAVTCPFFADQPLWARRVHALGAGPAPLQASRLSAGRLARAIRKATHDEGMRARATALGERIRAEDGVGRAVSVISRWLGLDD